MYESNEPNSGSKSSLGEKLLVGLVIIALLTVAAGSFLGWISNNVARASEAKAQVAQSDNAVRIAEAQAATERFEALMAFFGAMTVQVSPVMYVSVSAIWSIVLVLIVLNIKQRRNE